LSRSADGTFETCPTGETVEHPFGTMKARMGATHFLTRTLPKVAAEMALSVLAYNLTRVMNIVGTKPLMDAIAA
jgi:Transposase DDE domain